MSVKLISVSKPAVEGVENAEDLVAYCARVSNPSNQMNTETAPKLLRYLIKHKHWSPLEMVSMTLELKTSRAIAAQILRHRSFSFQEFSQRYSESTTLTPIEYRKQGKTNRQVGDEPFELKHTNEFLINSIMEKNLELYNDLIKFSIDSCTNSETNMCFFTRSDTSWKQAIYTCIMFLYR